MEAIIDQLTTYISGNVLIASLAALAAGILSSFTPCVLTSVPLIIGYVGGYAGKDRKKTIVYSLLFCSGLIIILTTLGIVSAALGKSFLGIGQIWYIILAVVMAVMGLHLLGVIRVFPETCKLPNIKRGSLGALVTGMISGVFGSPCATPVLIVVLAIIASGNLSVLYGGYLLFLYSIGHSLLVFIAGISTGFANRIMSSDKTQKTFGIVRIVMGVVIIIFSLYLFYVGF